MPNAPVNKLKRMYWMPGGKSEYFRSLRDIVDHLRTGTSSLAEAGEWIQDRFELRDTTTRSTVGFLVQAGLVTTAGTPTPTSLRFFNEAEPKIVLDVLQDKYWFLSEAARACQSVRTKAEIRDAANATGVVNWETDTQARIRLEWLLSGELVDETTKGYVLTDAGRSWLNL